MVNLNGLGVRVSGPQNHPCEALRGANSEDHERHYGVNSEFQNQPQAFGSVA